jgi:hypothetical protein
MTLARVRSHNPNALVMQMTGLLGPNPQGSFLFLRCCSAQILTSVTIAN